MEYNETEVNNLIKNSITSKKSEETFYITKDNPDGTKELIYKLKCEKEQAYTIFEFVIREQQKEYRDSNFSIKWRVIRMFDSRTGEQLCQES